MANQNSNGVSFADLVSMFVNNVGELPGEKGVPSSENKLALKNIIPSLGSTFNRSKRINPLLTSVEVARTYNTGLVLAKAFYDFNIKRKPDKKSSTIVSDSNATIKQSSQLKEVPKLNESLGIIASIVVAIIGISVLIYKFLGPIGSFISKFIVKIPDILKNFSSLKTLISEKLLSLLDDLKTTKLGEMVTKITSKLKPGIITQMFNSIGSFVGKKLGVLFKRLPLIGALMSFTFAYMRWQEGKYITSILEVLSGIANLTVLGGFLPGALISLAIDGVILLSDLLSSGDTTAKTSGFVHGTKLAVKSLVMILKNTASVLGKKLLTGLKFIPFIGGVAGLALAYMRFKDGDWIAGTVELVAAIADFIPGAGNIVSTILDGGLLLYDIFRTKNSKKEESSKAGNNTSFADISKKYGQKLMDVLWYVPGISGILYIGRAASKFVKGDITGGIKDLGLSIIGFVGGKGLVDFLSFALGLFSSKSTKSDDITAKQVSFADIISAGIVSMLSSFEDIFNNIVEWAKNTIAGVKQHLNEYNEKYNPAYSAWETISGYEEKMTALNAENERNAKLIAEARKKTVDANRKELDLEWDSKRKERLGTEAYNRVREREKRAGKYNETTKTEIYKEPFIITQPASAPIKDNYKSDSNLVELDTQTKLISLQNELLVQLVLTSKEQLNVSKNAKPTVAVVDGGSKSTNINTNNAFSTNRDDGRAMYNKSPYSISPSYA